MIDEYLVDGERHLSGVRKVIRIRTSDVDGVTASGCASCASSSSAAVAATAACRQEEQHGHDQAEKEEAEQPLASRLSGSTADAKE